MFVTANFPFVFSCFLLIISSVKSALTPLVLIPTQFARLVEIDPWLSKKLNLAESRIHDSEKIDKNREKLSIESIFPTNKLDLMDSPIFLPKELNPNIIKYRRQQSKQINRNAIRPQPSESLGTPFLTEEDKKLIELHMKNLRKSNSEERGELILPDKSLINPFADDFLLDTRNEEIVLRAVDEPPVYKSFWEKSKFNQDPLLFLNEANKNRRNKNFPRNLHQNLDFAKMTDLFYKQKSFRQNPRSMFQESKFYNNKIPKFKNPPLKSDINLDFADQFDGFPLKSFNKPFKGRNLAIPLMKKPIYNNFKASKSYNRLNSEIFPHNFKSKSRRNFYSAPKDFYQKPKFYRNLDRHTNSRIDEGPGPTAMVNKQLEMDNFSKEKDRFKKVIKEHFEKKEEEDSDENDEAKNENERKDDQNIEEGESKTPDDNQFPKSKITSNSSDSFSSEDPKFEREFSMQENEDELSENAEVKDRAKEKRMLEESEDDDRDEDDNKKWISASIPGEAGKDYPTLSVVPKQTDFSCKGKRFGYYADVSQKCQVYHQCSPQGQQRFLCPNGTLFNQESFVCEWWYNVNCDESEKNYGKNEILFKPDAKLNADETEHDDNEKDDPEAGDSIIRVDFANRKLNKPLQNMTF